jgi:oligopeptide/dipeptide ABC transporter ATP-binding protein
MDQGKEPLLAIEELHTYFFTSEGTARAVDGVSLDILPGETLGLVGESGCGKSVTALSILQLVPAPPGKIIGGKIYFEDRDLLQFSQKEIRKVRGNEISMIFQEPMTSLNPVFTIGEQVAEVFRLHQKMNKKEALDASAQMLEKVRIPEPRQRLGEYPHQLSGGMRQRVMIAIALACRPKLLIADEPTTALDVTVQAQILSLMEQLKQEQGASVLLITHDLGVIAEVASRVTVMYAGQVVETAPVRQLFENPKHPYTEGLLKSIPRLGATGKGRLQPIRGTVPSPVDFPPACRFHPRCPKRFEECDKVEPHLGCLEDGRQVRCLLYAESRPENRKNQAEVVQPGK